MREMTSKLESRLIYIHFKTCTPPLQRGKLHTEATSTSSVCDIHTGIITKQEVSQSGILFRLHPKSSVTIRKDFPAE